MSPDHQIRQSTSMGGSPPQLAVDVPCAHPDEPWSHIQDRLRQDDLGATAGIKYTTSLTQLPLAWRSASIMPHTRVDVLFSLPTPSSPTVES